MINQYIIIIAQAKFVCTILHSAESINYITHVQQSERSITSSESTIIHNISTALHARCVGGHRDHMLCISFKLS